MKKIKSRFAPSPTGFLHLGGARTALFAYLYAKARDGDFLLRIEDTDLERSTKEYEASIIDGLDWLGLCPDETPKRQSERFDIYNQHIERLLSEKKAYRCYCSQERLDSLREAQMALNQKTKYDNHCREMDYPHKDEPYVVRIKSPLTGTTSFVDDIRGEIIFQNEELDDFVIRRGDGCPTYNFCVVVDDTDSEITHVVRGEDHINNTPKQIIIYDLLNIRDVPVFAHLSMIHGSDGSKLSKRHGALNVLEYKHLGYLKEALLNMLIRLGWSHQNQEIFSLDEMKQLFSAEHISHSKATFDPKKLDWLNAHYIKQKTANELASLLLDFEDFSMFDEALVLGLIDLYKPRATTLVELKNFLLEILTPKEKVLLPEMAEVIAGFRDGLTNLAVFDKESIHALVRELCQKYSLKMPEFAKPMRKVIFGVENTPDFSSLIVLVGKEFVLERLG